MDNSDIQLIGSPCGQHGPYTFYKAFKYEKNGVKRIVQLSEFFFVKLWIDTDLLCIGELQLLWCDKNSEQILASLRLYFLPENTPEGRLDHGEDEVLAISEKVVLRVEDLITWITVDAEWTWGRLAKCEKDIKEAPDTEENRSTISNSLAESSLDFSDVEKEKKALIDHNTENDGPLVIILSYPRYCRYRAMMRRLEGVEDEYLKYKIVRALGGFTAYTKNTRVLFCKDTFDYPELEGHELLCNHLAPKLKGRPRGKRKKRSVSPGSESNESESSSISNAIFPTITTEKISDNNRNGLRCGDTNLRRSARTIDNNNESKEFLKELYGFMKKNYTPIGKIPSLGYKEIDLFAFYTKVQKLGGYDLVTTNRLWKSIFDEMSGHQNSTSATTIIRRHYERFLLPYERHLKGEEHKPLPVSERRRLKSKNSNSGGGSGGGSDVETSEGASSSRSGNSTPIPQLTTPILDNKELNNQVKTESKTASLRSIRVKPERQKEKIVEKTEILDKDTENIVIKTDKDNEPVTTAIAPIVVQKLETVENCKEEAPPPIIETGDIPKSPPIIPPPPVEIIDLDKTTLDEEKPCLNDMKKDKLDILKEGGLDITPIRTFIKDARPSVIQPTGVLQQQMPPPPPPPLIKSTQLPQALNVNQLTANPAIKKLPQLNTNGFNNNSKIVQSKSIYSYSSERTVYGNPREFNLTTMNLSKKHPEVLQSQQSRHNNCDILDLSVARRKKSTITPSTSSSSTSSSSIEIMRIPNLIGNNHNHHQHYQKLNYSTNKQIYNHLIDGRRLGSNVEITLVNNNNNKNNNKVNIPQISSNRYPQKRSSSEIYANQKLPKLDDNYKLPQSSHLYTNHHNNIKNDYNALMKVPLPQVPPLQIPQTKQTLPYLSHLYDNSNNNHSGKSLAPAPPPPPYLPFLDPFYYLYSHNNLNTPPVPTVVPPPVPPPSVPAVPPTQPPPILPFLSQEQLKFYSDLMVRNNSTRLNYPFINPNEHFKKS